MSLKIIYILEVQVKNETYSNKQSNKSMFFDYTAANEFCRDWTRNQRTRFYSSVRFYVAVGTKGPAV